MPLLESVPTIGKIVQEFFASRVLLEVWYKAKSSEIMNGNNYTVLRYREDGEERGWFEGPKDPVNDTN